MTRNHTADLALWLSEHTDEVAHHEESGEFVRALKYGIDSILRLINRPVPQRFCGPCPAVLDDGQRCGAALLADRDADEVSCPQCEAKHNIADVEAKLWAEVGEWLLTPSEIHLILKHFGEPVGESTLRRWRADGRLQPRGFRDGKPRFWVSDVRELRNTKQAKAS